MITDPHAPPPQSLEDVIQYLTIAGLELIKPSVEYLEANGSNGHPLKVRIAHFLLNDAGYLLEEACGVSDGTFGAGGTSKGW